MNGGEVSYVAGIGVSFAAGVVSVFSPCILPMLPIYLAMAGDAEGGGRKNLAWFAAGFILLFTTLAVVVSAAEMLLASYEGAVRQLGAAILALMGLVLCADRVWGSVAPLRAISQLRLPAHWGQGGYFAAGMVMGAQWIPCTGPIMTAVIAYAATIEGLAEKGGLWFAYCAGFFALPALFFAVGMPVLTAKWHGLQRAARWLRPVAGLLLLGLAYTLFQGEWLRWIGLFMTLF